MRRVFFGPVDMWNDVARDAPSVNHASADLLAFCGRGGGSLGMAVLRAGRRACCSCPFESHFRPVPAGATVKCTRPHSHNVRRVFRVSGRLRRFRHFYTELKTKPGHPLLFFAPNRVKCLTPPTLIAGHLSWIRHHVVCAAGCPLNVTSGKEASEM